MEIMLQRLQPRQPVIPLAPIILGRDGSAGAVGVAVADFGVEEWQQLRALPVEDFGQGGELYVVGGRLFQDVEEVGSSFQRGGRRVAEAALQIRALQSLVEKLQLTLQAVVKPSEACSRH